MNYWVCGTSFQALVRRYLNQIELRLRRYLLIYGVIDRATRLIFLLCVIFRH